MPRHRRIVVPGIPHHITQRGNRKAVVFHDDEDYELYMKLLAVYKGRAGIQVYAYCLMPNHIHLVVVPEVADSLRAMMSPLNTTYAQEINRKQNLMGHLFQDRFASFAMDDAHLVAAMRYVELNPVRAGLVTDPGDYRYSSAPGHLGRRQDRILDLPQLLESLSPWEGLLASGMEEQEMVQFRRHERNGYPWGDKAFVERLETLLSKTLRPSKRGRRPVV
jgi:putative transposase